MIRGVRTSGNIAAELPSSFAAQDDLAPACPRCGSGMVIRRRVRERTSDSGSGVALVIRSVGAPASSKSCNSNRAKPWRRPILTVRA